MNIHYRDHLRISDDFPYSLSQVYRTLQPPINNPSSRSIDCRVPSTLAHLLGWLYCLYGHPGHQFTPQNTDQLVPLIHRSFDSRQGTCEDRKP
jgi:hypothetical protein